MASNIQTPVKRERDELHIAEFGSINGNHLDAGKQYSGFLFRLPDDVAKAACEALSFNARFDLPAIRNAYIDVFKAQGWVVLEIERNTKPQDISVRYSRDRWQVQELLGKGPEGLRPWIRTVYWARLLEEETLTALAALMGISIQDLNSWYLRLDLKNRKFGIIAEADCAAAVPSGSYLTFNIQDRSTGVESTECGGSDPYKESTESKSTHMESTTEMSESMQAAAEQKTNDQTRIVSVSARSTYAPAAATGGEAKYATYSRSEVDYMLKQQAESIMNALSGKISAQQRAFQEAVAAQEKAFNKLSDNYLIQFESSRAKLEATAKTVQEATKAELEEFHKALSKELDQHRTQINKAVLPVAKALDGKPLPQPKEASAKQASSVPQKVQQNLAEAQSRVEKLLRFTLFLSLLSAILSAMALLQRLH